MIEQIEQKVWCPNCHAFLAKHVALRRDGATAYGGLHLAPGMVSLGKRTFGPSPRPRVLPRNLSKPLIVTTEGGVTLRCLRSCGTVLEIVVDPATVL